MTAFTLVICCQSIALASTLTRRLAVSTCIITGLCMPGGGWGRRRTWMPVVALLTKNSGDLLRPPRHCRLLSVMSPVAVHCLLGCPARSDRSHSHSRITARARIRKPAWPWPTRGKPWTWTGVRWRAARSSSSARIEFLVPFLQLVPFALGSICRLGLIAAIVFLKSSLVPQRRSQLKIQG